MRLFVAAELPVLPVQWLEDVVGRLRRHDASSTALRWQTRDHWHITLKFLGHCPDDKVSGVDSMVRETARQFRPFRAALGKLGTFGGPRGGVVHVAVEKGHTELAAIADHLQSAFERLGFPAEKRPFRAHVTLARTTRGRPPRFSDLDLPPCPESMMDTLVLYQSHLGGVGSRYEKLARVVLE